MIETQSLSGFFFKAKRPSPSYEDDQRGCIKSLVQCLETYQYSTHGSYHSHSAGSDQYFPPRCPRMAAKEQSDGPSELLTWEGWDQMQEFTLLVSSQG